jgi:chemotaxis protein methyltransferase CheR
MSSSQNPLSRPAAVPVASAQTAASAANNIGPSAIAKPLSANSPFAPRPVTTPPRPAVSLTNAIRPPTPAPTAGSHPTTGAAAAIRSGTERPSLSANQFEYFAKIIYELSGMRFEANKSYFLASKIELRIKTLGLASFDAYINHLNSPQGRTEYGYLIDEVSINETFFFRHEPQLQAFRENLLIPHAQARRNQGTRNLRIWSAASSTGDELYTLALMLRDTGLTNKDLKWELIGTDICHDALEKARIGLYRKYNVRNIPPAMLQNHFVHDPNGPTGETWQISAELRNSCKFTEGNLMDTERCGALGKFDFIFCRNVLIYFDEPSKEKAVQHLANALTDDGYVLLGHSENIYSQRHILRPVKEFAAAIAYQKAPPGTPKL